MYNKFIYLIITILKYLYELTC